MVKSIDDQVQLTEVVERLTGSYPTLPPDTVNNVVYDLHARFDGAPIREFVPLLVEREAHSALSERSASQGN